MTPGDSSGAGDDGPDGIVERESEKLLEPVELAVEDEYYTEALLVNMGWNPAELPLDELPDAFQTLFNGHKKLLNIVQDPPETLEEFVDAMEVLAEFFEAFQAIAEVVETLSSMSEDDYAQFGLDLVGLLVKEYLRNHRPRVHQIFWLLGLYVPSEDVDDGLDLPPEAGQVRLGGPDPTFSFERVGDLFTEPKAVLLETHFGEPQIADADTARTGLRELLPAFANFLQMLDVDTRTQFRFARDDSGQHLPVTGLSIEQNKSLGEPVGVLSLKLFSEGFALGSSDDGGSGSTQAWLDLVFYFDSNDGEFSVILDPRGSASYGLALGSWHFDFDFAADIPGLVVETDGVSLQGADDGALTFGAAASRSGPPSSDGEADESESSDAAFTIGGKESTRLEIGRVGADAQTTLRTSGVTATVQANASGGRLVVSPGDGDGFLAKILPEEGLVVRFDLGVGWSTEKGVFINGGGSLDVTLPIHQSVFGVAEIETVDIALLFGDDSAGVASLELGMSSTLSIGPVDATVQNVGVEGTVSLPEKGAGTLGPADADFDFKPPDGVGLSIEAGPVTGGGFLKFEPEKHRYSGTFELTIGDYSVTVVGLLKTKLPDGDGFSLLVLITGEFPPVQLGFGFTLNGIGGLAGVHRDMRKKPLGEAVRTGNLDSVLFPENVVENAQQIVSDLRSIFPPTRDVHVFGPMARFAWGTPTILTMDVGIVLAIPAWKIAILGKMQMALPDEDAGIVQLNLAVVGVLDIPNEEVSIDASLYDSRIVAWTVSGDMALRAGWGDDSSFMLSVGGFHPRYSPPKSFPELDRVRASLGPPGGNPRLEYSGYLAVTPNTFQVGAGMVLHAEAGPAKAHGELSIDALFRFNPFKFVVDFFAKLLVKIKRFKLGVEVDGTLSGPKPVRVKGALTIKVAFVSMTVHLDVSMGSKPEKRELPAAKVFEKLKTELSRPQNWDASRPEGNAAPVSLRDPTSGGDGGDGESAGQAPLLVHPLGTVSVRQTVVPLSVSIEKYGNAKPRNTRFALTEFEMTGESLPGLETLRENFAPAKFQKMSDSEKLNSEAFEKLPAGRRFRNDRCYYAGEEGADEDEQPLPKQATLEYESSVVDEENGNPGRSVEPAREKRTMAPSTTHELAKTGAVATSGARTTGASRYRSDDASTGRNSVGTGDLSVSEDAYVVVREGSLRHVEMASFDGADNPIEGTTQIEARQALQAYADTGNLPADAMCVVAAHEVRSYVVVEGEGNSRVDMGGFDGAENPVGGRRAADAREAMRAYAEAGHADAADLRVVPAHDVGTSTQGDT